MKILILSKKDFACSGLKFRDSINSCAINKNISCKIIIYEPSLYANPTDYDFIIKTSDKEIIQNEINSADIIHFKGDDLPSKDYWLNFKLPNIPIIITVGGSGFRRNSNNSKVSLKWFDFNDYIKNSDFRTTLTPDLNYPDFNAYYIQQCINSRIQKNSWVHNKIPIISHSPSHREKKGTDKYIIPAIEILKKKGYKFKFDLIENVSNIDCINRKKKSNIFIDQVSETGFYGISALEAMQFGIPVIAHISDKAKIQSDGKIDKFLCPIINVNLSVFSVYEELKFLLNSDLKKLSISTKNFCDNFHSYETVGNILINFYKDIISGKKMTNTKSQNYWNNKVNENLKIDKNTICKCWENRKDKKEIEFLCHFIKKYNINSIIDIGSGTGTIYWFLKTQNYINNIYYKMVDFSSKLRTLCQKLTGILPDEWNGVKLKYNNDEFDLGISHSVLFHVDEKNIKNFLIENTRVCKYFFIATYNGKNQNLADENFSHNYIKLFKECNLQILEEIQSNVKYRMVWLLKKL